MNKGINDNLKFKKSLKLLLIENIKIFKEKLINSFKRYLILSK